MTLFCYLPLPAFQYEWDTRSGSRFHASRGTRFRQTFSLPVDHRPGQHPPFLNSFLRPWAGWVRPDIFEFVFENHDRIDDFVQTQKFFQVRPIFDSPDVGPVSQEKIFGAFEDRFAGPGGFLVFAVPHLTDDQGGLSYDMKQVESELELRDFRLDGNDIGVPHIHHHGFQRLPLFPAPTREKSQKTPGSSVFSDPNHTTSPVIQERYQISVAFADGDFVDGQEAKASIVGLPELFFQELLVSSFDRFPF